MEILILLMAAGGAIYLFIKSNQGRGVETVRASIYLGGMQAGVTAAEANQAASIDVMNGPTEAIANAIDHLKIGYGGKQLPMIADAYRQGMRPKLPIWYRIFSGLLADQAPVQGRQTDQMYEAATSQNEAAAWVRPFALYYLASEFNRQASDTIPGTVRELVTGNLSAGTEQSLLVCLRYYLRFAYGRESENDDLRHVIEEARILVRAELQTGNSHTALRRFLRRKHTENGAMTISQNELDDLSIEFLREVQQSDEVATKMRALILRDGIEEMFADRHGKSFAEYETELMEYRSKNGHGYGVETV